MGEEKRRKSYLFVGRERRKKKAKKRLFEGKTNHARMGGRKNTLLPARFWETKPSIHTEGEKAAHFTEGGKKKVLSLAHEKREKKAKLFFGWRRQFISESKVSACGCYWGEENGSSKQPATWIQLVRIPR